MTCMCCIYCATCGELCDFVGGWAVCPENPQHHIHADDGTVEGCGGCFAEPGDT